MWAWNFQRNTTGWSAAKERQKRPNLPLSWRIVPLSHQFEEIEQTSITTLDSIPIR